MKILQLGKFYPIVGGVEKVMLDLTTGLSQSGVPCDMLCAEAKKGVGDVKLNDNATIFCVPTVKKLCATMIAPRMITRLRSICRDYDIIHVHHPDPMAALALRLSGYEGRVVLHWHSDILKQRHLLKLYQPLQTWLLKRADIIFGTSPIYLAESPFLKDVQSKCKCLPIGILPVPEADAEDVDRIRQRYHDKKIIFSLGRLVHYKGYQYLIDAARQLPDDYVVAIGGGGQLHDELQQQIDSCGLGQKVTLLGRVADCELPAWFHACHLFCLSSIQKTEAFAIVQAEAMSCGKPIVATKIKGSGVSWVNQHGTSGLNVEPANATALAQAIRQICENPSLYQQLAQGALKRYQQTFTMEKMMENYRKELKIDN